MPEQANVKSSDAIDAVRVALLQFAKQAEDGLTEIDAEMRRMVDWMEHNRPGFWQEQVRLAWDERGQAKNDLNRCLMFPVGVNERPSCSEERAALKKAEAKLAYCEEKRERLQNWLREIHHETHTYEGRTMRLREVIEQDVPQAATALARLLASIEKYTGLASPGAPSPAPPTRPTGVEPEKEAGTNDAAGDESTATDDPPQATG